MYPYSTTLELCCRRWQALLLLRFLKNSLFAAKVIIVDIAAAQDDQSFVYLAWTGSRYEAGEVEELQPSLRTFSAWKDPAHWCAEAWLRSSSIVLRLQPSTLTRALQQLNIDNSRHTLNLSLCRRFSETRLLTCSIVTCALLCTITSTSPSRWLPSGGFPPWLGALYRTTARPRKRDQRSCVEATSTALPLWEQNHPYWTNTLAEGFKKEYMVDTDLVDLVVDCSRCEIFFNWRATYALFFLEQDFAARARNNPRRKHTHDEELYNLYNLAFEYDMAEVRFDHIMRARQRRLSVWTAQNKHRMSGENRLVPLDDEGDYYMNRTSPPNLSCCPLL